MKRVMLGLLMAGTALSLPAEITDPGVREGKLPNGLSYYICRNIDPKGQADFFLARNIGSRVEAEDEKGLAHFLEHMCFNGSKHFPDNKLIEWLESVGVKFGKNLNAHTSADETVYNISAVPTVRESVLDSCLLILRDWSDGLTLSDQAIESERGVIKGEYRHRDNASSRMLRRAAPRLYPGSPYGEAMPIGTMEVIENFPPEKLRDFYRTWYRPDASAIIVTGDIDPDAMEQKIKERFSDMQAAPGSKLAGEPVFPLNETLCVIMESDPEQTNNMLQLYFKIEDNEDVTADEELKRELIDDLVADMLVERYDAVELKDNTPVSRIGIGKTNFLLSRKFPALVVRAQSKPGRSQESLADLYREIRRARELGFSQAEFKRAVSSLLEKENTRTKKEASRSNTEIANGLARYFTEGGTYETPQQRLQRVEKLLADITAADCLARLKEVVNTDGRNVIVLGYNRQNKDGVVTEDAMAETFYSVNNERLEPFTAQVVKEAILAEEPVRGRITKEENSSHFGATLLTLSNGVKVMLKKTDYKKGQVFVRGVGEGGFSQIYTEELAPSMKIFNEGMALSGAGSHSNGDLRRMLAGRDIKVSVMADRNDETLEVATINDELEDAMRLLWLKATAIRPDREAFKAWYDSSMDKLESGSGGAVNKMGELIHRAVYSNHPLGHKLDAQMLSEANYDTILSIYKDRFMDFSDFTFYITGDFDIPKIKDLLERYVASLPTSGRMEKKKDIGYRFTRGNQKLDYTEEMLTPTGIVYQFRHLDCPYNLKNILMASITGQILKARLLKDLREEKGWTYGITTHGSITAGMNGEDEPEFMMPVYVKTDPAHIRETAEVIKSTIKNMGDEIGVDEFEKVREFLLKNHQENMTDNAYWLAAMRALTCFGQDLDSNYDKILASLHTGDICSFIKTYVIPAQLTEMTMSPK